MKPKAALRHFLALAGSALLAATAAQAASGTWNANADGDWNTTGNWDLGIVAGGAGSIATLGDFIDADRTINLDIAPIIGGITAADATHNYTISGANTLTLDSTGSSAVNVATAGRTLTIASVLNGNDGITKSGAGTLALSNANLISGIFALTAGTLQLGHATAMGTSTLTMTSGTTLQLRNDADTTFTAPINTAPTTGVTYNIDVNRTASGTGRTLSLGNLTFATPTSGQVTNTINVTGGNGYILGLGTISAPSSTSGGPHPFIVNATTAAVTISKFSAGAWGNALTLQGGNAITLNTLEFVSNGNNSLTVSGSGTVVTLGSTVASGRNNASPAYTLNSGTLNLTTTTSLANVFTSGTASAPTFAINGGTLNNTSGSALTLAANSGLTAGSPNITIGGDFAFGTVSSTSANNLNLGNGTITNAGNRTITFNGTGTTLTMGGTMSNTSGANQTTTVNGAGNTLSLGGYALGSFTNVINGTANVNITGAISGTGGLTYGGNAKLTLTGANTYGGLTTVNSGTLVVSGGGRLYTSLNAEKANAVTVNSGATMEFDNWNWDGSFGQLWFNRANIVINGGTLRYVGTTANASTNRSFTIGASGATLESATSGQKWVVTSGGSYTTLASNGGTLTLTGAGDGQIDQIIPGSGGLTKSGNGTWTLAGANSYTGVTTLSAGTLSVGTIGNGGVAGNLGQATNAAANIVFDGGTLQYTGANATSNRAFTINAGKTATIQTTNNISFAGATGTATNGALTKTGAGTLTLTGTNTYTGATTVSQGILNVTGSIATSTSLSIAAGATVNATGLNSLMPGNWTIAGTLNKTDGTGQDFYGAGGVTLNNGTISGSTDKADYGTYYWAGTTITANGSTNTINTVRLGFSGTNIVNTPLSTDSLSISSILGGTAAANAAANGTLTKNGAGTLSLTGVNGYIGNTTISAGTLRVTGTGRLYSSYNATAVVTVQSGGVLELDTWSFGASQSLGQLQGNSAARIVINGGTIRMNGITEYGRGVTVQSGGATFEAASGANWTQGGTSDFTENSYTGNPSLTFTGAGTGTFAKVFSGTGALTKSGAGNWTLSGANTYSGVTNISGGTLSAGNIVVSGGNSHLGNATSAVTLGSASEQGTLSYTGNSATYTRGFTIGGAGGGRLDVTTSGQTLTVGTGAVTGSGLFTVGGAGNTTISANLTHTGGLTKTGAGTLTISGNSNTYTGTTTVTEGTLALGGTGSIASSPTITVATGATLDVSAVGGGWTLGASQTLGGTGTLAGAVTINGNLHPGASPGVLSFSSALALGANSTTTMEIDGATRGTGYDGVNVGSTLALDGNLLLDIGAVLASDGTFDLFAVTGATSGDLDTVTLQGLMGSGSFSFAASDVWSLVDGNNTWTFTESTGDLSLTIIPEPGTALLGGLGILLMFRRRR